MLALFPGVPGGPELLVVLVLLVVLFGLPVVVAVLGWRYLRGDSRVAELEARVAELESELEPDDSDEAAGAGDSGESTEPTNSTELTASDDRERGSRD